MSDYQQYVAEKEKIDFFIVKGYHIKSVEENLEGSFLLLEKNGDEKENVEQQTLHIKHADARKYFASILIRQQRGEFL
ncbi:hypothetical protein FIU87_15035 [Bacillus sp. THAF10]|uniref:hypothetical protein n=1 Tax=Bacillus sp. THAF10 TaxID=2587848 RepID=UPI001267DD15|nr:hypothetical protein [Bacillus sp. THAF10]QFT89978.1 hypothetical protein FIU87_15035 [Bacillus sp. THAF10]